MYYKCWETFAHNLSGAPGITVPPNLSTCQLAWISLDMVDLWSLSASFFYWLTKHTFGAQGYSQHRATS